MHRVRPDVELVSIVNDEPGADRVWRELGRVVRLPLSPRSRVAWAWAELAAVAGAAARARVELLHSPANFGPALGPFARVLTLHDLLYRRHPELLTPAMRLGTAALVPLAARRADRVIAVSGSARDEIVADLGIAAERIDVIPNGVAPPRGGDAAAGRDRLGAGGRRLVVSVASDLPHKNLGVLIDALALLDGSERPLLALVGHGTDAGALGEHARQAGVGEDVLLAGAASATELDDVYAAADALVTSTLHEGFGLPVLEAMARGVPVVCSDLPVLREVGGDCADFVDPREPASVAAGIGRVLAGGPGLEDRRRRGIDRARRFTWDAAAEATGASYERALQAR